MWQRNPDTGKWSLQVEQLPKDNFEKLKQDFESVKLYSRCLSGSTYIMIDDFDNIYNTLQIDEIGYYLGDSAPPRGSAIKIDTTNSDKFYQKYLKENAFTIKNLFTPNKLIEDESKNLFIVDVATTEEISGIDVYNPVIYIDGLRLLEGHRILIKDQQSTITLPNIINKENYFTNEFPVSNYYLVSDGGTDRTYSYYNDQNGIYKYTNGFLIKESDINTYDGAYKSYVVVNYGNVNKDKQYHLLRLKNNYYPVEGDNVQFEEKHNWILRHRFDYNNILELNHYDILKSSASEVYSLSENFTYSIPERLIAVGEFGTIINNQDILYPSATWSNSTIINSKYKVNLRSIDETNDYYWICGDEGTLLKVWKPDFSIERIELGTFVNLNCVTFFDDLRGFVVGKFNRIYFTDNGGKSWDQLKYDDFDPYSYYKVKFVDENKAFVVGTSGMFLELTRNGNDWTSYKRKIYKTIDDDRLDLVDDLYDLLPYNWVTIKPFQFSVEPSSKDFADSLVFNFTMSEFNYPTLKINISTKFENLGNFKNSFFSVVIIIENSEGLVYSDSSYSFFREDGEFQYEKFITLPIDDQSKLIIDEYTINFDVVYNYDGITNQIGDFQYKQFSKSFTSVGGDLYLLSSDDKLIVYDLERNFYDYNNDFIYLEFDQKVGDIRTISKSNVNDNLFYFGADRVYSLDFSGFSVLPNQLENYAQARVNVGPNLYLNRIFTDDKIYLAGNDSLLKTLDYATFSSTSIGNFWDPTFKDKFKPKLLFLDYDAASKLNFFTDTGQYRMPDSISVLKTDLFAEQEKVFKPNNPSIFQNNTLLNPGDIAIRFLYALTVEFRNDDVFGNNITGWLDIIRNNPNPIKGYFKFQSIDDSNKILITSIVNYLIPSKQFVLSSVSGNLGVFFNSDFSFNTKQLKISYSETLPFLGPTLEFKSLTNQTSWIDYYKDSEKTFEYYTSIQDSSKVEFSTTFSYTSNPQDFVVNKQNVSNKLSDIVQLAPSLSDSKNSEYFSGVVPIIGTVSKTQNSVSPYDLLIYKNILIIKQNFDYRVNVGDVIRIENDVVDCNFIVNKVTYYYKRSGENFIKMTSPPSALEPNSIFEKYIYCFHSLNQNIINNLIQLQEIGFTNLNKYHNVDEFVYKFNRHQLNIAYKLDESDTRLTFSSRFNNKTAYYNLGCRVITIPNTYQMNYNESFLTFGFSPTYNILDSLNKLNDVFFVPEKKFYILPEYVGLPSATNSVFVNSNIISDGKSNKLLFGEDFKFQWESLLIWTFFDIRITNNNDSSITNERFLVINKYFDSINNYYVVEFHKKLILPDTTPGLLTIDIISRNTLQQISDDLQVLNNIQRSQSEKSINSEDFFTSFTPDVKFKFPTESYLKVLASDFDIQQKVTGVIYTDYDYQIGFNLMNTEKELKFEFNSTIANQGGPFTNKVSYSLTRIPQDELKVGDLVYVKLLGNSQSSKVLNPQYQGLQTIVHIDNDILTTSKEYNLVSNSEDIGTITFIKRDEFLNYLPIDLFDIAKEKKPKVSIEILPEMVQLNGQIQSLVSVDTNKFKLRLVDGLFLQEIENSYSWLLQAEVSNVIVGKNDDGLVWYTGVWKCGRWFNGTWISGEWLGGDWYSGNWYSSAIRSQVSSVEINQSYPTLNSYSKWQGGRWFGGNWFGGSWFDGRRYGGDWRDGVWYNGIWNDGDWYGGTFQGGIWVLGRWFGGSFNCDTRPSYWLDGEFVSGDFENGIWYNGQFGNKDNILARFGTRSINTRISVWNGGKWIGGEFHSYLNIDESTGLTTVSDIHTLSVWKTGQWLGGEFYGGVAYNIDFKGGTWKGGILEEIQVSGLSPIYPLDSGIPENMIRVKGLFKFSPGDEIYIIDDNRDTDFSNLGNNSNIGKYRINRIYEDTITNQTELYLNYNLADLTNPIDETIGEVDWSNIETGLRVVSHFVESKWESGYWTNGYFENGTFESGNWHNGVFDGNWGI